MCCYLNSCIKSPCSDFFSRVERLFHKTFKDTTVLVTTVFCGVICQEVRVVRHIRDKPK